MRTSPKTIRFGGKSKGYQIDIVLEQGADGGISAHVAKSENIKRTKANAEWNAAVDALEGFLMSFLVANKGKVSKAVCVAVEETMNNIANAYD